MIESSKFQAVWEKIRKFWNYPRINSPRFLDKEEAIKKGMEDEIAGIRMDTNEILINKKNLEERVGAEYLPSVASHEVGHYMFCPYNLRNFVRLIGHADLVVNNLKHAKLIQNLYSDLCVNTRAYRKGDYRLVDVYKRLSRNNNSELWQLYISTFENMIGCQGKIIPPPKEEIREEAKDLAKIVGSAMDQASKWPDSIKEFADIIQKYIIDEEKKEKTKTGQGLSEVIKGLIDNHKARDFLPYDPKKTPEDVLKKEIQKELRGLAEELGQEEFRRVVRGLGLGGSDEANVWFYDELADKYNLLMPQMPCQRSGEIKESPKIWTTEEPIRKLDIEYTLRRSPEIIPNITTWQWQYSNGKNFENGKEKPDLLIVLDASGSMPDPRIQISFPLLSAKIAAKSAIAYGCSVAVIVYSDMYDSCDFTMHTKIIDEKLIKYFGGGTIIPGKEMVRLTSKHVHPIHTIIISDTFIYNLDEEAENLEKTLKNSRAGASVFLCCEPSDNTKKLEKMGYCIRFARNFDELCDLTIQKSKELYST